MGQSNVARKKGKKNRQIGRNKIKCAAYRVNRSYKNKLLKLKRHLNKHPDDACAQTAIQKHRVSVVEWARG